MDPGNDALTLLSDRTTRYARYSRSAGGMSLVLGGVLLVVAFALNAAAPITLAMKVLLIAMPAAWFLSKEILRVFYYQRAGIVVQPLTTRDRHWRLAMVLYLAVVAALIVMVLVTWGGQLILKWPAPLYLALVSSLPFAARRWFWSAGDFLVGTMLICQAAVVSVGIGYSWPWLLFALGLALIVIPTGWREHRDYLVLRRELGLDRPAGADA